MHAHSLVTAGGVEIPMPEHWPAMLEPGLRDRAESILEAIVYATDGDDIPTAIELAFLAILDNWHAAGGDADAIASRWALRHLIPIAPGVEAGGAPCGHCGRPAFTLSADGMPMHHCCELLPRNVPCIACRESGRRQTWRGRVS